MERIASPKDLQDELRRLTALASEPNPSRAKLAFELVALADKLAGQAFTSKSSAVDLHLHRAMLSVEDIEGLLHYRLHGEGHKDDFTGEPTLTPEQQREAKEAYKVLQNLQRSIKEASKQSDVFRKTAENLDEFMKYI